MNRKDFLHALTMIPMANGIMNLQALRQIADTGTETALMPLLFLGHGSPMNALEENEFVNGWRLIGQKIPKPAAVLCISAHWETRGTFVTAMEKPRTIHDFGGFPQALFDVQYPTPGSPAIAAQVKDAVTSVPVGLDQSWGLDHGSWSVVKHLYPAADVPVLQMSLDRNMSPQSHYNLARELAVLRKKGVLIAGSGNMVHNLAVLNWQQPEKAFDWATEASSIMKQLILSNNHQSLINYASLGKSVQLSIPTPEHYLPLLYILGLKTEAEKLAFFNDKTVMGSISMTSLYVS